MIEIKNLTITNKDINTNKLTKQPKDYIYNIDFKISEDCIIGIYSHNNEALSNLLKTLSGINKTKNVKNSFGELFDNSKYFKNRIYLDFKNQYIKTLSPIEVKQTLESLFRVDFDIDSFKAIIKKFKIHEKTTFSNIYEFQKDAKTLLNFALLMSLNYKYAIIDSPTININDSNILEEMFEMYKEKFQMCIFGINKLTDFCKSFEYIIVLDDNNQTRYLQPDSKVVVCANNDIESLKHNIMFVSKNELTIVYAPLTKEELKTLQKAKIDYYLIDLLEIEAYL